MTSGVENCCSFEVKILIKYLAFSAICFQGPRYQKAVKCSGKNAVWNRFSVGYLPPQSCMSLASQPLWVSFSLDIYREIGSSSKELFQVPKWYTFNKGVNEVAMLLQGSPRETISWQWCLIACINIISFSSFSFCFFFCMEKLVPFSVKQ